MDNETLIQNFKNITACTYEESKYYLESHQYNLEDSLATYFGESNTNQTSIPKVNIQSQSSISAPPTKITSNPQQSKPKVAPTKGGVRSLRDFANEDSDDDDEEKVNWFTGGEKSGIQVQAPKKKNKDDIIDDVMNVAKQSGAKSASEYQSQSNSFTGSGFQLGSSNVPTKQVNNPPKEVRKSIAMWKNGFSLDDGPLRKYDDPVNASFLDDVKKGIVPREIRNSLEYDERTEISVELKDNRNEDYKEPVKVMTPFFGSGQKLGGPSTSSIPTKSTSNNNISISNLEDIKIDETQPTTNIQIRCADGSKLIGKFNLTHTIKDIRRFIDKSKGISNYDIFSSFPSKIIADESQTISTAGLANSVVIQKPK